MADFQPITHDRHGLKRWQGSPSYAFAAADAVCTLVAQEFAKAALSLPIGFMSDGEGFSPVAIMGLAPGTNLYVAPNGRWLSNYIPAPYRAYPFRLGQTEQGEQVLCVDEATGLISENLGIPFFNEDQTPGKEVLEVLDFLVATESNRAFTRQVCAVFHKHQLIQPWPITLGEQQIAGLFRIDEAALNALSAEALLEVRNTNALVFAYCQLLSMQHLSVLIELAHEHNEAEKALKADLGFGQDNGTFSFGA